METTRSLALELFREIKVSPERPAQVCQTPLAAFKVLVAMHDVPPLRYSYEDSQEERRSTD